MRLSPAIANARRTASARRLPDRVRIARVTARVDNPDGTVTPQTQTIYEGPARVRLQNVQERASTPPGATQSATRYVVVVPVGVATFRAGDVCTVLESDDQDVAAAVLAIATAEPLGSRLVTIKLPATRTT